MYFRLVKQNISIFILIAISLLSLYGCGKQAEQGQISDVDIRSSITQNEGGVEEDGTADDTDVFKDTETSLDYDFAYAHIGRANLSIPYPNTWSIYKKSDYNICFRAPSNDPYFAGEIIWFHSTLEEDPSFMNDLEEIKNHQLVRQQFEGKIQKDEYFVKGRNVSMLPSSSIEQVIADERIVKPEYQYELSYRDWDANVTPSTKGIYHQDVTFYWRDIPCILSSTTTNEQAEGINELLMYMMSNSVYVTDSVHSVEKYSVFGGDTTETVKMCPIFKHYTEKRSDLSGTFDNVATFVCPMDSGTGYSQTNITFYKIKKNKWPKKITESFFNNYCEEPFLSNVLGYDTYMNAEIYGTLEESSYNPTFCGIEADEYLYQFDLLGIRREGYFDRQRWDMMIHTFSVGDYAYIMTTTYPVSAAQYGVDAFAIASSTFDIK